jgi:hypothetical protein
MGTFLDLFTPNPKMIVKNAQNVFKSRNGKPFVQSVARNMGHISFGENAGNWVDQNILRDGQTNGVTTPINVEPLQDTSAPLAFNKSAMRQQVLQFLNARK